MISSYRLFYVLINLQFFIDNTENFTSQVYSQLVYLLIFLLLRTKAAIQARAKRELEREKIAILNQKSDKCTEDVGFKEPVEKHLLAVSGVYYRCGLVSDEVLDKETWYEKLEEFFGFQLADGEAGLSACLIITSCNDGTNRINQCIEVLTKYLDNIRNNPTEMKYWKIRMSNKVFQVNSKKN